MKNNISLQVRTPGHGPATPEVNRAAEPWKLDIASISRTSIKCDGDRSRANSDNGLEEPCGRIEVRSSSSVGLDFVVRFMNDDQKKSSE
jgi:hypothetical protein